MATRVNAVFTPRSPVSYAISYSAGAQVNGAQEAVSTVTVHSGHGIATGDKFLYALTEENILVTRVFTAGTVTATTVPFTGDTYSFPDAALLIPLGTDTGGTQNTDGSFQLPNWDGSTITMSSDMACTDTITSVTVKPDGDAGHWVDSAPVWVIGLSNGNKPVEVLLDVAGAASIGGMTTRGTTFPATPTLGDRHLLIDGSIDRLYTYMNTSSGNDWVEGISAP